MYITRLQAIDIAISAIRQLSDTEDNRQAIERLENIRHDCKAIKWTCETVRKALDEWSSEHGRNPTVTDLAEPNMPKAVTIQRLFDMKASAFLNIYYPNEKSKRSSKYTVRTEEEWISDFIEQYNSIRPDSAKEYNAKRDRNSPTWLTVARYLNVAKWSELLDLTGVCKSREKQTAHYTVEHSSPAYDKISELLDKR